MFKNTALSLMLVSISSLVFAKTLYVSPTGDDTQACELKAQPCQSLATAYSKADSGDSIQLAQGTYNTSSSLTINETISISGGYNADYSKKSSDASLTVINGSGATGHLFVLDNGHTNFIEIDTLSISNVSNGVADGGVIYSASGSSGGLLRLTNVKLNNNSMSAGAGAIVMLAQDDQLEIKSGSLFANNTGTSGGAIKMGVDTTLVVDDARFENNIASTNDGGAIVLVAGMKSVAISNSTFFANKAQAAGADGGAIYIESNASITPVVINNSSFIGNKVNANGGAIAVVGTSGANTITDVVLDSLTFLDNGNGVNGGALFHGGYGATANQAALTLINSTFNQNNATNGAAVALVSGGQTNISYSTFYGNGNSSGNAAIHAQSSDTYLQLFANLIVEPNIQNLILQSSPGVDDDGYNIVGFNGSAKASGFTLAVTSETYANDVTDIIETELKANGGKQKTFKLSKTGPAIDKIANDAIPFYGVGTTAGNPFTSLAQANGALKSYENYDAGVYYFDLGGSYTASGTSYTYTAGPAAGQFSTHVSDDGWILVASSNASNTASAAYTQVSNLQLATDQILSQTIIQNANFDFTQVRISTADGVSDPVNAISTDQNIIDDLEAYVRLRNTGVWSVYQGGTDRFGACAYSASSLDSAIYDACDETNAVRWSVASGFETQNKATGNHSGNLNLWVRANGLCNGALTLTDGRGLPRADYLNPNDPAQQGDVNHCDIGAFEFNDGYKIDCFDEDGLRPDNYFNVDAQGQVGSAEYEVCFGGDVLNTTPAAIIDNLGSFQYFYSLILLCLLGLRLKKSS